jgi:N-acetylglucosaminyldiphosphoundecaprenol N-acetyl-beta-D-mannosaminyltransferase
MANSMTEIPSKAAKSNNFPVMNMLGINMVCLSYEDMYPMIDEWLKNKQRRSFAFAVINVHICVSALMNKILRDMYNSMDLVSIDSMPFLYWARLFYNKHSDRFYAPDLMLEISSRVNEKGYSYYLYGGYPEEPVAITNFLKQKFKDVNVVGHYSPPFRELTQEEDEEVCKQINSLHPDIIWVGLGSPKQDVWINQHLEKIRGSIMVPSGATFDFFGGRIKQAPLWIRNSGFEWLFRLTQDFRRLFKRYTIYNLIFIIFFIMQRMHIVTFDKDGFLCFFGHKTKFWND